MVEIAEELVEAMYGRQELVLVAEVVLTELAGDVAERLEQLGDRRVVRAQALVGAWQTDLGEPVRIGDWPVMKAARPAVQLC